MANPTENPLAVAAAKAFDATVDGLVLKNLAKAALPELKGLAGVSFASEVASNNVPNAGGKGIELG